MTGIYWYEYVAPGVGGIKEVDHNEDFSYWAKPLVQEIVRRGEPGDTAADAVGVFRPCGGTFYLDKNASGTWEGCGTDRCLAIRLKGDTPLVGDWDGTGTSKVGIFRPSDGMFYLDYNGNGIWDGCGVDRCLPIGLSGDVPLVGNGETKGRESRGARTCYTGNGTGDKKRSRRAAREQGRVGATEGRALRVDWGGMIGNEGGGP